MPKNDLSMTPFSTHDPQQRERARYQRSTFRAWTRRRERERVRVGSMLAKIGVCMALLGAVVLVQMFILKQDAAEPIRAVEASGGENTAGETGDDDVLGRLRFVNSGEVKSVFAVSQRWRLPVKSGVQTLSNDDTLLCISAKAGDTVSVAAAGEVRAISHDETLGDYVRVNHGSDLESVYYNLSDIRVEAGQPLMAQDTLGTVGEGGNLYIAVLLSGAPQNPSSYLDTGA